MSALESPGLSDPRARQDTSDPRASARPVPSDPRASARQRPYETLLAKGEDRKQRILEVAERLLARNGWRNTSLAQIAKEAGVSPAGLLHHFESKEQLLNAVLDARDVDDGVQELFLGLEVVQQPCGADPGLLGDLRQRRVAPAVAR